MRLPAADKASIDPAKIRDYLLSPDHPVGRFKARFFAALGYSRKDWPRLRDDLLAFASAHEATPVGSTEFGQKYELHGILEGPLQRQAMIVAVWIVLRDEDFPRFVTAFPGEDR